MAAPVDQVWHVLLDLAESLTVGWTLVGGQMVLLHALEHGQAPAQISQDGDIIADVRTHPRAIASVVAALETAGFHADGISPEGLAHRYVRPSTGHRLVTVDVLAPEGLGPRADLTTTPPGRTLEVPAGSQALARTEWLTVEHEGRTGRLPRPSLLAAIIGKSAAIPLPGGAERHLRDLALLLCLVQDPLSLRDELTVKDRTRLALARPLLDSTHTSPGRSRRRPSGPTATPPSESFSTPHRQGSHPSERARPRGDTSAERPSVPGSKGHTSNLPRFYRLLGARL